MKTEWTTIYNYEVKDNVEKEYTIYTRDELLEYIKNNNIDLKKYVLELHTPYGVQCCIANLEKMNVDDEFFFNEENKEITLYMD